MQEIKKSRIVIASVLKPVDDTRMFEKMAQSLSTHLRSRPASAGEAVNADIQVFGYPTTRMPQHLSDRITLRPSAAFPRLSFARLLMPWRLYRTLRHVRADLLIINTHELLPAALLLKARTGCRVVYDIRENYYRNILHTHTFGPGIRHVLALYVRLREKLAAPWIDHFLVAEKTYPEEMRFLPANRTTIVENKLKRPAALPGSRWKPGDATMRLLFSGTLAESTGVFQAVALATALHAQDTSMQLTLIGYCARPPELEQLQALIRDKPFITLIGGGHLVPHPAILDAISQAHFGIIAYPPNPSTHGAIPTKLYEYLGYGLPILLTDHPLWLALCAPSQAALSFDPQRIDASGLLQAMKTRAFYTAPPQGIYWEDEEIRLTNVINGLI
jgi:hypothetical protein